MKKHNLMLLRDKKGLIVALLVFILLATIIVVSSFLYYFQVQNTFVEESTEYLTEISKQISQMANKTFADNFSVLTTLGTVVKNVENLDLLAWKNIAQAQQEDWKYNSIILVDKDGVGLDGNGVKVKLSKDTYLFDAIINGKPSMSAEQNIYGRDCIIFIMPIDGIVIDGISMRAIATSYLLSTFDTILSLNAFDGRCYAHIIRNDGAVVIRSSSEYSLKFGYNILTSLNTATFPTTSDFLTLSRNIQNGVGGATEFTLEDNDQYLIYTPLAMEGWMLLTFVPVSIVNGKSDILLNTTLLICTAISLSFMLLIAYLFFIFQRNKGKLENIAYIDSVTQGNTSQKFYKLVEEKFQENNDEAYALVYINMEKFKVWNEQYGENACDNILKSVYCGVNEDLTEKECMGRLVADNFCVLICDSDKDAMLSRFEGWYHNFERIVEKSAFEMLPIIWKLGVYSVIEKDKPLTHMIDRAKLALTKSAHERRGRLHFSFYDEKVRKILFKEKNLEDIMESALSNNEFQVYLQPKYLSESEKIGGAEALVRWQRPTGLIFPDEFIPLFEQNGFIIQIDLFVFREVCKLLRSWIDNKYEPIKISVNCSRVHLINSNFFDEYKAIAQEYNIPPKYLEIEFTENILFDNVELLIQTINDIHSAGFGCSMDDFGSGYSSLNLIQQIPVDTIKLDKIFFCNVSDFKRTEAIVSSVISMAKALGMGTVAEGVEIREQVDMLKELKCDLIQGYFYSKPLPISCFEELAFAKVS